MVHGSLATDRLNLKQVMRRATGDLVATDRIYEPWMTRKGGAEQAALL